MVCSYCHQDGHYRTTCRQRKADLQSLQSQTQPVEPQEPEDSKESQESQEPQQPEQPQQPEPKESRPRIRRPRPPPRFEHPPNGQDPILRLHWTDKVKADFIRDVQSDPLTTNWHALAHKYQRTPESLKETYRHLVPPTEHIDHIASLFQTEALDQFLQSRVQHCTACHEPQYAPLLPWRSDGFCPSCHHRLFEEEIQTRWRQVTDYAEAVGLSHCEFCQKPTENGPRFHFDHRNMFEKTDSIQRMVQDGRPMFEVLREIDLCQILCTSCHSIVTEIERISGFHRLKNNMTRERKRNISSTLPSVEEMRQRYEEHMTPIYAELKKRLAPK